MTCWKEERKSRTKVVACLESNAHLQEKWSAVSKRAFDKEETYQQSSNIYISSAPHSNFLEDIHLQV